MIFYDQLSDRQGVQEDFLCICNVNQTHVIARHKFHSAKYCFTFPFAVSNELHLYAILNLIEF